METRLFAVNQTEKNLICFNYHPQKLHKTRTRKQIDFGFFLVHFSEWCDPGNWTAEVPDEHFPLGGADNRVMLNNTLDYTEAKVSESSYLFTKAILILSC